MILPYDPCIRTHLELWALKAVDLELWSLSPTEVWLRGTFAAFQVLASAAAATQASEGTNQQLTKSQLGFTH